MRDIKQVGRSKKPEKREIRSERGKENLIF